MADPTLVTNVTPYTGFSLDEITEQLLATRGMTIDSTTGRVVATSTEQSEAYRRVRRAWTMMNARFPSLWSIQLYSVAWTAGDTMLALPASIGSIIYVNYNGIPLKPLTRSKFQALSRSEDLGGDFKVAGKPTHYFLPGFSDEGASPATDYRLVIELIPHPGTDYDTKTIEVAYNSKAPALPRDDSDDGNVGLPVHEAMQEWLLRRSQEIWAADESDAVTQQIAREERAIIEDDIDEWIEANNEYPQVAQAEYPSFPSINRDS